MRFRIGIFRAALIASSILPAACSPYVFSDDVQNFSKSLGSIETSYKDTAKAIVAAGYTEEMAEFAKKLNKVDKDGNLGVAGFIPDFSWSHLDIYTRMFGGGFYNADGTKITLASEPVVQALEWEKQFYLIPGSEKVDRLKSGFGDYNSPQAGFYTGKVAMMVEGEWQPTFIKKFAPNLRYGVAPLPYPAAHPERKGTVVVAGTVMAIPTMPMAAGVPAMA